MTTVFVWTLGTIANVVVTLVVALLLISIYFENRAIDRRRRDRERK